MRIVITGAGGALGGAVVRAFAERGDQVAAIVRHPLDDLPAAVRQVAAADLADPAKAATALGEAAAALGGGVDALVHLVGSFAWSTVEGSSPDLWRRMFSDNVETTLGTVQAGLPWIADSGAILCIGAAAAQPVGIGMAPYAAAKSAVARLVEALAAELKPRGIRVNAVLPGTIDTPRNRADMPEADPAEWTSPAAIADVVLFLTGAEARAISGALIPVTHNG